MKKLLSLLSALTLGATTSLSVIACGGNNEVAPEPWNPVTENTKIWSNQTSNIAKALIISKNENFNTNRLLNNALSNNEHNIKNEGDSNTGSNYDNFKTVWGYHNNIEGITESEFNNDNAATIDNDQIKTKEQIKATLDEIQGPLSLIAGFSESFTDNKKLNTTLDLVKAFAGQAIWDLADNLKKNPETIEMIKSFIPMIEEIINNIDGFNAEKTLGEDFKGDITTSLFGENGNDGWLNHYTTSTGFSSEAVKQESSILNPENFTSWDQVALFKSSIDLNGFIYQLSGNNLTLGQIFEKSIKYDNGAATDFDINEFINQIGSIWSTTPENIINLVSILIPIVKYQLLGINPTQAITKISTSAPTDKEKGILNVKDIISTIENIILTKDGFTNFITSIFFPKSEGDFNLGNYATFDFTIGNQALSEVILPIKGKIVANLDTIYTEIIEPTMKNVYVQDIVDKIKEIVDSLKSEDHFEINLSDIQKVLEIVNDDLFDFLDKLTSYDSKDELLADWAGLWAVLGLQDKDHDDFVENSGFAKLAEILKENPNFIKSFPAILGFANNTIQQSIDVLVTKETSANLDFNNDKLWTINDDTIGFIYDEELDETSITYNLIDNTKGQSTIYKVIVVVKGNADEELGSNARQVWIKSLIKTA